jgi:hypothetical protein
VTEGKLDAEGRRVKNGIEMPCRTAADLGTKKALPATARSVANGTGFARSRTSRRDFDKKKKKTPWRTGANIGDPGSLARETREVRVLS